MALAQLSPEEIEYGWRIGDLWFRRRKTQLMLKFSWEKSRAFSKKFYIESTRRLGKSTELLQLMAEECIKNPGKRCAFFAPVKDALLDYVKPIVNEVFADCPTWPQSPRFNDARFMLEFDNGSSIIFRGSNNQQHRARRGQEFHLAGIDEARDVQDLAELIDSVVFPSLFESDGFLIISSTPADTRSHELFQYRQRAKLEGWFFQIKMSQAAQIEPEVYTPEKVARWKAEICAGPDGADRYAREFECDWIVNKSRQVVPEWKLEYEMATSKDPYYQFYKHYIFLDWGYSDFTAVGFGTHLFRRARLQVESELTFSGQDARSDKIAAAIEREARNLWGDDWDCERMIADSADPLMTQEVNKYGKMNFTPVQKSDSLDAMIQQFRGNVNAGRIYVDPKCAFTMHCLQNAVWTEKRDKLDSDVFARHFDHLMALVYGDRMIDYNLNPIPADFMVDGVRIVNFDYSKNQASESAKAMEGMLRAARV